MTGGYDVEKRKEALALYVKSQGTEKLSSLSRKTGVHRDTLRKWKKSDEWEARLAETRQSANKKVVEKMADQLSDEIAKHFKIDFEHLDILDKMLFLQLIERDEHGQPVRGPDGLLRPNSKTGPADLKRLAGARHQISTTRRMILGLPTEHQQVDQNISGEVKNTGTISVDLDVANKQLAGWIKQGKADQIAAFQKMAEAYEGLFFGDAQEDDSESRG